MKFKIQALTSNQEKNVQETNNKHYSKSLKLKFKQKNRNETKRNSKECNKTRLPKIHNHLNLNRPVIVSNRGRLSFVC